MVWQVRLGRKFAVYLPREVVEKLGLREGDKFEVRIANGEIVLKPVPKLLKKRGIWAEVDLEDVERVGEELSEAGLS